MQLLCFSCIHAILFVILIRNPSLSTFFNESPFFTLHSSSYCESISNTHFSSFKSETHSLLLEGWDEKKKTQQKEYFPWLFPFFNKIFLYDIDTDLWLYRKMTVNKSTLHKKHIKWNKPISFVFVFIGHSFFLQSNRFHSNVCGFWPIVFFVVQQDVVCFCHCLCLCLRVLHRVEE